MTAPNLLPHEVAALDQSRAEVRALLRFVIGRVPGFTGTRDNQDGTCFLLLRKVFPTHDEMAAAASELVRMLIEAEAGEQS